ncbi:hypothetical protein TorRG33x02_119980 [Trema orientale]|uniref:Uncharacterized protein n=1 Tax=Trema orientale TaxID=63057 RepID=A0A2P5F353_TREOI|nr:hypothetical protein TorRG33x02_119980 [Trema orientale]
MTSHNLVHDDSGFDSGYDDEIQSLLNFMSSNKSPQSQPSDHDHDHQQLKAKQKGKSSEEQSKDHYYQNTKQTTTSPCSTGYANIPSITSKKSGAYLLNKEATGKGRHAMITTSHGLAERVRFYYDVLIHVHICVFLSVQQYSESHYLFILLGRLEEKK